MRDKKKRKTMCTNRLDQDFYTSMTIINKGHSGGSYRATAPGFCRSHRVICLLNAPDCNKIIVV